MALELTVTDLANGGTPFAGTAVRAANAATSTAATTATVTTRAT